MQRTSFTTQTCAQNTICRVISEATAYLIAAQNTLSSPLVQNQGVAPDQLNQMVFDYHLARARLEGMVTILNEVVGLTPEAIVHLNQARLAINQNY